MASPTDFIKEGKNKLGSGDFQGASECFSRGLESKMNAIAEESGGGKREADPAMSIKYGDKESQLDFARIYRLYGQALLRLAQSANDLMGDGLKDHKSSLVVIDDDEDESTESDHENTMPAQKIETKKDGEVSDDIKASVAETLEKGIDAILDRDQFESRLKAAMKANTIEDREISWESLQTSVQLYEALISMTYSMESDQMNQLRRELADVHALCGELLIENEIWTDAIKEFEKSIEIHLNISDDKSSVRERSFCHFMASLAAENGQLNELYATHLDGAFECVCNRLIQLLNGQFGQSVPDEMDADGVIEEIQKVIDSDQFKKETTDKAILDARMELTELNSSLKDLIARYEETGTREGDENEMNGPSDAMVLNQMRELLERGGLAALASGNFPGMDDERKEDDSRQENGSVTMIGKKRSRKEAGLDQIVKESPSKKQRITPTVIG